MSVLDPQSIVDRVLLYWQTEDLLRAYKLDAEKLLSNKAFAEEFAADDAKEWLIDLAIAMEREGVKENGHTSHSKELIKDLEPKHIDKLKTETYKGIFESLKPAISAYAKQKQTAARPVYILFELLYAFYLKRLSGEEIPPSIEQMGTQAAHCLNELANG
ncbi:MAG: DUF4924 family protein [Bacteroidia bacterium]